MEQSFLRDRLIEEMKLVFGADQKRIDHALLVLDYAERIHAVEGGALPVVQGAAILHDIGIHQAQRKYHSTAGKYQEIEGVPIAAKILARYDIDPALSDHICRIIAHHHSARDIDTMEFKIIWDADWLVNIPEEYPGLDQEKLHRLIDKVFKTGAGRHLAEEMFLVK